MYTVARLVEARLWVVMYSDWPRPVAEYESRWDAVAMAEWANRQVREGYLSEEEINNQLWHLRARDYR